MYGREPAPAPAAPVGDTKPPDALRAAVEHGEYGWLPALWLVLLIIGALLAGGVAVLSLFAVLQPTRVATELVSWGVLPDDAYVSLLHDASPAGDMSAGCAVSDGHLHQWADRSTVGVVSLTGATVTRDGAELRVEGDGAAACLFSHEADATAFAAALAWHVVPRREPTGAPRDPRVESLASPGPSDAAPSAPNR